MPSIILSTLNARYIHSAFGLRYLMANLGDLQPDTQIKEYVIQDRPIDIVEDLLQVNPRIIGLGVYLWNIEQTTQVVALLKKIRPQTLVVLGGPEVSYEYQEQAIVALADYVITGYADREFHALCEGLLQGTTPPDKIIHAKPFALEEIRLPYQFYTDADIAHRIIYVEASRGCPYKCEFCLSALDKTAWSFDLDTLLAELALLYDRGARQFKFVDRTFNLKIDASLRILDFFLQRMTPGLFLHFEVIPDHLPDRLKTALAAFPPGTLQFEVGIQTLNSEVQALISRKQDNGKSLDNLRWLREHSHAHLHADLIIGLPGEDLDSIARGFNTLAQARPHEIQVGILKRLRGSPIIRHTDDYRMVYNPHPPYNILSTSLIDFPTLQRLSRFARYWDIIANAGHFTATLPMILGDDAFGRFMMLSDWLYAHTGQTHRFALDRIFDLIFTWVETTPGVAATSITETLWHDYQRTGMKKIPRFAPQGTPRTTHPARQHQPPAAPKRQSKHLP